MVNKKFIYHFAPKKLRSNIKTNGLIPKLGLLTLEGFGVDIRRFKNTSLDKKTVGEFWNRIRIVNLAKHGVDVVPSPKIFFFTEIPSNSIFSDRDLWQISLENLNIKFYKDDLYNAICTSDSIPPENLKLL